MGIFDYFLPDDEEERRPSLKRYHPGKSPPPVPEPDTGFSLYDPSRDWPLVIPEGAPVLEVGEAQMDSGDLFDDSDLDLFGDDIEPIGDDLGTLDAVVLEADAGAPVPSPEEAAQAAADEELRSRYGETFDRGIPTSQAQRDAWSLATGPVGRLSPLEMAELLTPAGGYFWAEGAERMLRDETPPDAVVPQLPRDISLEAAGHGAVASGTLDTSDEMIGAANAVGGGGYVEGRDIARDRERAAQLEEPDSYAFGRALGMIPHLALPAAGAGRVVPMVAEGAGFGAVAAGGASEADVTTGDPEELARFAGDVYLGGQTGAAPSVVASQMPRAAAALTNRGEREVPFHRMMATTHRARNETRGATDAEFQRYLGADPMQGLPEADATARAMRQQRRDMGITRPDRDAIPVIRAAGQDMEAVVREADGLVAGGRSRYAAPGRVSGLDDTAPNAADPLADTSPAHFRRGGALERDTDVNVRRDQDLISTTPGRANPRQRAAEQEAVDTVAGPRQPRHAGVEQGFNSNVAEFQLRQRAQELRSTGLAEDADRADVLDAFREMYATTPERIGIEEAWQRTMLPELRAAYQRHTGAELPSDDALFEVRRVLSAELDAAIGRIDPELASRWSSARETYRVGLPAAQIGSRQITAPEGLGRYEAYGIAQSPNPVEGIARAAAVRTAERRAHRVAAGAHETIASAWQGSPELMERFGETIRPAMGGRPEAVIAAHYVLWEREPEYREAMRQYLQAQEEE